MSEWFYLNTDDVKISDFNATQVGQHRKRLLQPWFHITLPNKELVLLNGRSLLWSVVDALFPDDKLPRIPMLESMKADPPQFSKDLQSFFIESDVQALCFLVGDAPEGMKNPIPRSRKPYEGRVVELVCGANSMLAPDIEDLRSKIEGGIIAPFEWKDRNGVTLVPSLVYGTPTSYAQAIDIGKRVVVLGHFLTPTEKAVVRPLTPSVLPKQPGWLSVAQNALNRHYEGAIDLHTKQFPSGFDPIPNELYSMERFSIEQRRSDMGF